jgi:hypothetical protein
MGGEWILTATDTLKDDAISFDRYQAADANRLMIHNQPD